MRKLISAMIIVTACQASLDKAFANGGDLKGIGKIHWQLTLSDDKLNAQKSDLQQLIQEKLKSADIPVDDSAPSQLIVTIAPGKSTHIVLSATEAVPLPNNSSVKKDVAVWTQDVNCNAKSVSDKLGGLLDAFAIQYLKDNKEVSSAPSTVSTSGTTSPPVTRTEARSNQSESSSSIQSDSSVTHAGATADSGRASKSASSGTEISTEPLDAEDLKKLQDALNANYSGLSNKAAKQSRILFETSQAPSKFECIYNTCGDGYVDDAVKIAVKKLGTTFTTDKRHLFLAVVPPQSKTISVEPAPIVDFSGYMKQLQSNIKSKWYPSKSSHTKRAMVIFDVFSSGKINNLRFDKPTEDPAFDGAAMAAVYNATIPPYPAQAADYVTIAFTFDYNVWAKSKDGTEHLVNGKTATNTAGSTANSEQSARSASETPTVTSATTAPLPKIPAVLEHFDIPPRGEVRVENDAAATRLNNDGVRALQKQDYVTAVLKFQESLKLNPGYVLGRNNLAIALNNFGLQRRAEPVTALRFFHWAAYIDQDNQTTRKNIDGIIRRMGKSDQSFDDRNQLGVDAENNADPIGALLEYKAACEIKDDAALRTKIGDIYAKRGENSNALEQYELAQKLAPSSADLSHKIEQLKEKTTTK